MKFGWAVLLLLIGGGAGLAVPCAARAQGTTSVYAEYSASRFHNLISDSYLNGATVGVVFDSYTRKHLLLSGDVQGRFLSGSGRSYDAASIGPRVSVPVGLFHLVPYGEFLVGFARFNGNAQDAAYNGNAGNSTTDAQIQLNAGVTKRLTPRFDVVVDYSYSQFYAYGGQFNPKTFSGGAVYHFTKR